MADTISKIFKDTLLSKEAGQLKLLGDSITHGVGGTGFAQSGEPIVAIFSRNPDGYCWANLMRDYLAKKYGCRVVNNACTGRTIEFIIQHFDKLVDEKDDLIICTIGTNNRHQYFVHGPKMSKEELLEKFYANIVKLHGMFKAANKTVIFVANIPATGKQEQDGVDYWRIAHMWDINDTYKQASKELGFPLISMYDLFTEYYEKNNISLDSLLKDELHPNDEGYRIMFELFKGVLGV